MYNLGCVKGFCRACVWVMLSGVFGLGFVEQELCFCFCCVMLRFLFLDVVEVYFCCFLKQ